MFFSLTRYPSQFMMINRRVSYTVNVVAAVNEVEVLTIPPKNSQ